MQREKVLKIRFWGGVAQQLDRAAAAERVAATEIVRRAMQLYFSVHPVADIVEECGGGPSEGSTYPLEGPWAPSPPSSSPPSSPSAPPLTPPSLSPPAPSAANCFAAPATGRENGLLFPELGESPGSPGSGGGAPPPASSPLLLLPCIPDRRSARPVAEWPLTARQVAQWEETFPGMDVLGEARKAREWLLANHRKTHSGMRTYLFRWLCKAQNSGRFMRRAAGRPAAASGAAPRTLLEVYGFASFAEWEAELRKYFAGEELEQEIANVGKIRAKWEARHG